MKKIFFYLIIQSRTFLTALRVCQEKFEIPLPIHLVHLEECLFHERDSRVRRLLLSNLYRMVTWDIWFFISFNLLKFASVVQVNKIAYCRRAGIHLLAEWLGTHERMGYISCNDTYNGLFSAYINPLCSVSIETREYILYVVLDLKIKLLNLKFYLFHSLSYG
jgi:hypothetical protein